MQTTNPVTAQGERDFSADQPRRDEPRAVEKDVQGPIAPDLRAIRMYRNYVRFVALAAGVIGAAALLGWIAGVPILATLNPVWVSMKVNTAIAFVVSGVGLFAAVPAGGDRRTRTVLVVRGCGAFVAAIGLATWAEYVFGRDFGIDQLLIAEPAGTIGTTAPGRMAELAAINFAAFGVALVANTTRRDGFISTLLTLLVLASSVLVLTGYFLGTGPLYQFSRSTIMAFPTAMAFLLLSAGFLLMPRRGVPEMSDSTVRHRLYLQMVPYLFAVMGVDVVTVICFRLSQHGQVNKTTIALAMLLATQLAATVGGRWPALLASILAALAYDYFFLPPPYTFIIEDPQDWIALAAFFITAVMVGELSGLARRRAEAAETGTRIARRANSYNRGLLEASLDPLVTIGRDGRITDVNAATETITGLSREEIIGTDFSEYFADPDRAREGYESAFRDGVVRDYELNVRSRDGVITPVLYNAAVYRDETGEVTGVFAAARDISEIRRAEQHYHALVDTLSEGIIRIDENMTINFVNAHFAEMLGYSVAELIGRRTPELTDEAGRKLLSAAVGRRKARATDQYELTLMRRDGQAVPALISARPVFDEKGEYRGSISAVTDLTSVRRAEREIRHLASFPRLTPLPIIEFNRAMQVQFMNPAMQEIVAKYAIDPAKLVPARWVAALFQPDGMEADKADVEELQVAGRTFDERIFFTHEFQCLRIWLVDITESKESERLLARLNHTLRTLSSANQALVHAETEAELLHDMCQVLVNVGGYRMAWIGLALHDADKNVQVAAVAGHDEGYAEQARVIWADNERGRGPTGTAIRTGEAQVNRDFATNPRMASWREQAMKRGYQSSVALPLSGEEGTFGALTIYAGEPDAFGADELKLLDELAKDLAYGILALRSGAEREAAVTRLHESLEDTVGAIASTIEMRDPYTAGHQRRVARLASLIAAELKMTKDQQRGIFLAGLIHDIGKINIPAEILSKPGKLTRLEMEFIRTHPQAGYDIIKGVEFPWPIAEAVLQHHERLDGSGYPRGLSADAVIPEARILAVADVTEAITAHRPYRPALGLDAALNEIQSGKGRLYDTAAVDACVDLFRNKGFRFD